MLPIRHFLMLALSALLRNRAQAGLAMLGVVVGVGALVTSLALGGGAQQALNDQLRAAGANTIIVRAGNYQVEREERSDPEGNIGHTAVHPELLQPLPPQVSEPQFMHTSQQAPNPSGQQGYQRLALTVAPGATPFALMQQALHDAPADAQPRDGFVLAHFEDDPLEMHDHPLAKERLGDLTAGLGAAATLNREDARAIATLAGVQHVVAGVHENARVFVAGSTDRKQWFTRLHGTEAALPEVRSGWTFPYGRFLNENDVEKSAQVMVLGRVVADRLFGEGVDPVGREILLWNQLFKVVGVVSSRSWATQPETGDDQFDAVYIPVTAIHRLLNLSKLNTVTVTAESIGDTTRLSKEIVTLLRQRHKIAEATPDDFTVTTVAQQVLRKGLPPQLARAVVGNMGSVEQMTIEQLSSSLRRSNRTMMALLGGVATVSLLVGGIGVMNLLLLSVTQRTREVGLRIALGARRSDIAWQFVLEAILLSVIGGLLGVLCGAIAAGALENVFKWSAVISPLVAGTSVLVAALLGVAFGLYPARRAAQLDPIEALRHE